jgi:hypothetical protein
MTDHVVPPTRFAIGLGMDAGAVVISGQGVADEDGIILGRVEFTVGFVADGEFFDASASFEKERLLGMEILGLNKPYLSIGGFFNVLDVDSTHNVSLHREFRESSVRVWVTARFE